jgi:ActR/RegA family two-component response regulator
LDRGIDLAGDVLLLDDDDDLLDAVSDLIRVLSGRTVWRCRSYSEMVTLGESALGSSLAILDINLGEGVPTGLDALAWLRERRFGGRVVFLTGHARGYPLVEAASRMSDVKVLSKPSSVEQLRDLLKSAP